MLSKGLFHILKSRRELEKKSATSLRGFLIYIYLNPSRGCVPRLHGESVARSRRRIDKSHRLDRIFNTISRVSLRRSFTFYTHCELHYDTGTQTATSSVNFRRAYAPTRVSVDRFCIENINIYKIPTRERGIIRIHFIYLFLSNKISIVNRAK